MSAGREWTGPWLGAIKSMGRPGQLFQVLLYIRPECPTGHVSKQKQQNYDFGAGAFRTPRCRLAGVAAAGLISLSLKTCVPERLKVAPAGTT